VRGTVHRWKNVEICRIPRDYHKFGRYAVFFLANRQLEIYDASSSSSSWYDAFQTRKDRRYPNICAVPHPPPPPQKPLKPLLLKPHPLINPPTPPPPPRLLAIKTTQPQQPHHLFPRPARSHPATMYMCGATPFARGRGKGREGERWFFWRICLCSWLDSVLQGKILGSGGLRIRFFVADMYLGPNCYV